MLCLVFHQYLKCHILTRTGQQCGSYGGHHLAGFCLTYLLINFRKLSFSGKKVLSAIKHKIFSFLERKIDNSSKSDCNKYLFEI